MNKSTDFNTKDGPEFISVMKDEAEILAFIEGDERKTVIDAANKKIAELRGPKQGEQTGPITQKTAEFKGGVEGTKSFVTCEDVLKKMRAQGKEI